MILRSTGCRELLYPGMEDYALISPLAAAAPPHPLGACAPFTLGGTTTRAGAMSSPLL